MSAVLLARDVQAQAENKRNEERRSRNPRLIKAVRALFASLVVFFGLVTVGTTTKAQAGISDLGDQIASQVVNFCNPNILPLDVYDPAEDDPLAFSPKTATYNPVTVTGTLPLDRWSYFLRTGKTPPENKVWSPEDDASRPIYGVEGVPWFHKDEMSAENTGIDADAPYVGYSGPGLDFIDDGDVLAAARANGPTMALRELYKTPGEADQGYNNLGVATGDVSNARATWNAVQKPQYVRYGLSSLQWTTYGSKCTSFGHWATPLLNLGMQFTVHLPIQIAFLVIELALNPNVAEFFWQFAYPITGLISKVFTPVVAFIAIFIGLPYVWVKSKGSLGKLMSSALWVSAMMFAVGQLSPKENARAFTETVQGSVALLAGSVSCTISNSVYSDFSDTSTASLEEQEDLTPINPIGDNNGNIGAGFFEKARAGLQDTPCGSYINGIQQSLWQAVPLQIWAEGEVGAKQASKDRASQGAGYVGWYQAILNAKYARTNDVEGRVIQAANSLWDGAGYIRANNAKPLLWDQPARSPQSNSLYRIGEDSSAAGPKDGWSENGKYSGGEGVEGASFAIWRFAPYLQLVKIICKDDNFGTNKGEWSVNLGIINIGGDDDNPGSHYRNKWMYEESCTLGTDGAMISAMQGHNIWEKAINIHAGSILAQMVMWMTVIVGLYVLVQRFVWGWMLMFAPIILGVAAFPDEKRRRFAIKYGEFVVANVVKQVGAILILVLSMSALQYILFPAQGEEVLPFATDGFMRLFTKSILAGVFLFSALFFLIPIKKIIQGAIKGDADAALAPLEYGKNAVKVGGAVAGVAAGAALGGGGALLAAKKMANAKGVSTASALKGMGKTGLQMGKNALQNGGLSKATSMASKAALFSGKGKLGAALGALSGGAGVWENAMRGADELMKANPGMSREEALKNALKNNLGVKGEGIGLGETQAATRMALAANNSAIAKGAPLPYGIDENGELTPAGLQKAVGDWRSLRGVTQESQLAGGSAAGEKLSLQAQQAASALQARNPNMSAEEALAQGKDIVMGQTGAKINALDQAKASLLADNSARYVGQDGKLKEDYLNQNARTLAQGGMKGALQATTASLMASGNYDAIVESQGMEGALKQANFDAQRILFDPKTGALTPNLTNGTGAEHVPLSMTAKGAWVPTSSNVPSLAGMDATEISSALDAVRETPVAQGNARLTQSLARYERIATDGSAPPAAAQQAYVNVLDAGYNALAPQSGPVMDVAQSFASKGRTEGFSDTEIANVAGLAQSYPISAPLAVEHMRAMNAALESGQPLPPQRQETIAKEIHWAQEYDRNNAFASFATSVPMPQDNMSHDSFAGMAYGTQGVYLSKRASEVPFSASGQPTPNYRAHHESLAQAPQQPPAQRKVPPTPASWAPESLPPRASASRDWAPTPKTEPLPSWSPESNEDTAPLPASSDIRGTPEFVENDPYTRRLSRKEVGKALKEQIAALDKRLAQLPEGQERQDLLAQREVIERRIISLNDSDA